ncbi:outer membrane beta-barrel protein [Nannocystis punicea]|uniref:Outer membrane beta-barrel protein n=1 Tax=Nannocystis punicea TaxID=2995304 RepID=A0ABY7H8B0_9BACT|nr:outer membrane beta-barrel protein [Nannocystis poenicansa]WAS95501.1 outer membrane beta-barrel protein [Nannocystis poenicansa]
MEGAPSAWAAPPSARGPFACLSRRCKEKRPLVVPAISTKVGRGILSLNLYGDFGYAFGPQGKHQYYDYITKQEVEDVGRRDFTSYPLYANQFAMAYGFVQGQYEIPNKIRFRFALHAGHIVESLYNEEPKSLQLIREAAIYYFFHPKLAVEAGILPSYYGAEIVLNKENLHATRAYIADFTPDYEAGVRLHYHVRKDMTLRVMVLNGWQEIRDANGRKGFGFVWSVFKPFKIVGDWTMYWGNEAPAGEKTPIFRHYQNLYYRIWLGKRWLIFPMFDFVMQKNNEKDKYDFVVAPAFSARLAITEKVGIAARYEYLYNKADIVPELRTNTPNGWQSHSGALTLEYLPLPQLTFRVEGRYGANKDAVFRNRANQLVKDDWYVYLGGAFHF